MNKQLTEAIERMTEKGYSADFIARAYPYLIQITKTKLKEGNPDEDK